MNGVNGDHCNSPKEVFWPSESGYDCLTAVGSADLTLRTVCEVARVYRRKSC
jgi:hypothetical protein